MKKGESKMPTLSKQEQTRLAEAEAEVKYVGCAISVSFHEKLRNAAKNKGISLGGFLREALIEGLEKIEAQGHGR
jgi:predicted HicB family RNase H-like nuclease